MFIQYNFFLKFNDYVHFAGGLAYSNARFGAGTGPIFLDDVACTSSASQLLECSSLPILSHNCLHTADAGVGCKGMFGYCIYLYWTFIMSILHSNLLVDSTQVV